jgi:hypothetical protein
VRFDPWEDPYQYAANIRAWSEDKVMLKPSFNVGFAVGEIQRDTKPFDFPLSDRTILPDRTLVGHWVGRGAGWLGDALFDSVPLALVKKGTSSRMDGAPGLLLMYIIHKGATGQYGIGIPRSAHTPTFGIAIPAGGPKFRWILQGQAQT